MKSSPLRKKYGNGLGNVVTGSERQGLITPKTFLMPHMGGFVSCRQKWMLPRNIPITKHLTLCLKQTKPSYSLPMQSGVNGRLKLSSIRFKNGQVNGGYSPVLR